MKKIISITLILVLVFSSTTFAFAHPWKEEGGNGRFMPPGLAKKGGLPPGIAKKFKDIDGYDWAKEAIERMAEKGVVYGDGEGLFAPKRSVTKLEAVVMALRVMGEKPKAKEYQIKIKNSKIKFKLKGNLQEWAYGYVKLAEEKGILDEADLLYFKLNEPATRHEVAKYIVRAMGYEDKAETHMDEDLDYKDAAFIPQGSVGYIYVADEEKIITGYPDGTFRALDKVTRAQMAVMVARLEGKVEVNEDDEAINIVIDRESEDREYKGIVTVTGNNEFSIHALYNGNKIVEFKIDNTFEIDFEDEEGNLEDLRIGDEVKVVVKNNKVIEISVERDMDFDVVYGRLDKIYEDEEQILVYINSKYNTYSFDEDVEIFINAEDADLDDLREDDNVRLEFDNNNEVIEINAYR